MKGVAFFCTKPLIYFQISNYTYETTYFFFPSIAFKRHIYVEYTYDQAGNRLTRKVIILSPPKAKEYLPKTDSIPAAEQLGDLTVTVYPNPTYGALRVRLQGSYPLDEKVTFKLYNAAGALVYNSSTQVEPLIPLDMSAYGVGWYVLHIKAGEKSFQFKIIKK